MEERRNPIVRITPTPIEKIKGLGICSIVGNIMVNDEMLLLKNMIRIIPTKTVDATTPINTPADDAMAMVNKLNTNDFRELVIISPGILPCKRTSIANPNNSANPQAIPTQRNIARNFDRMMSLLLIGLIKNSSYTPRRFSWIMCTVTIMDANKPPMLPKTLEVTKLKETSSPKSGDQR
jgi:hypothetical protein